MQKKKLLILSVSAGSGHVRAAQALEETTKIIYPDIDVVHMDMIQYVTPALRKVFVEIYDHTVKKVPGLWRFLYRRSDDYARMKRFDWLTKKTIQTQAQTFLNEIERIAPDAIICTHSFPARVLRASRRAALQDIPLSVVVTDYGLHVFWLVNNIDTLFVATDEMKQEAKQSASSIRQIIVSGIPVSPIFFQEKDSVMLKRQYAIDPSYRVLLVLAGGQGLIHSDRVVELLLSKKNVFNVPVHIIAISGKNDELYEKLLSLQTMTSEKKKLDVIQWTDAIDDYMRMADVVITKPGGITTTECATLGRPILAVNPIPGQEETNAAYIEQHGFGHAVRDEERIVENVRVLLEKKEQGNRLTKNAAEEILRRVVG